MSVIHETKELANEINEYITNCKYKVNFDKELNKEEYIESFWRVFRKSLEKVLPERATEEEFITKTYKMLRIGTGHIKRRIDENDYNKNYN